MRSDHGCAQFDPTYSITSSARPSSGSRDGEAERLGGLEVDDQLDFGRLLDRQIGGLLALENPAGVDAGLAIGIGNARSVAHQAAGRGELAHMGRSRAPHGGPPAPRVVRAGW